MKKIIFLAFVLFAITAVSAEKTATLNIKKNEFHKDKATRDIFGGFIELVSNFVNGENGLWAQELINRGFDNILYPTLNSSGIVSNWDFEFDTLSESSIKQWSQNYNPNGSWCLKFEQANNKRVSIRQNFILTDSVDYDFYVYTRSDDTLFKQFRVSIWVSDFENNEYLLATNNLQTSGLKWEKKNLYLFVSHDIIKTQNINFKSAYIKIESLNNGVIYIDEVSLMPSNNINGIRKEQFDLYSKAKFGNLRYPGGSFADTKYNDWKNTILPIDQRRSPLFLGFNNNPQRFDFGLKEYIQFCKIQNINPYLTVNYLNGTAKEAAELVEFCNGDTSTTYGKLRMQLGDTMSYKVKYFEIGNEQWDNKYEYSVGYLEFYNKMKEKDSTIQIITNGNCWDDDSFDILIGKAKEKCQIFGYHPAKGFDSVSQNDNLRYLQSVDAGFEEYIIEFYKKKINEYNLSGNLVLGSTEWWSSGSDGRTWLYDNTPMNSSLNAALWNANMLMIYLKNPDIMKLACRTIGLGMIKQGINSIGKREIFGSPSFNAFSMLSNHFGQKIHNIEFETELFNNHDIKNWIDKLKMTDVLVSSSNDSIYISYINKYPSEDVKLYLNIDGLPLQTNAVHYELWANDYKEQNTVENPNNVIEQNNGVVSIRGKYNFKPHSFNVIAIPIKYNKDKIELIPIDTNLPINNNVNADYISLFYNDLDKKVQINAKEYFYQMKIEIFDLSGALHIGNLDDLNEGLNSIDIQLSSGVYYAKISDKFGNFIVKSFVVQN